MRFMRLLRPNARAAEGLLWSLNYYYYYSDGYRYKTLTPQRPRHSNNPADCGLPEFAPGSVGPISRAHAP